MKTMAILGFVMGSWLLAACSSATDTSDQGKKTGEGRLLLAGASGGCQDVQQICTASQPPQCFDYCNDPGAAPGTTGEGCQPNSQICTASEPPVCSNVDDCSGQPCVVGIDANGTAFQICYPSNCVISHDSATGVDSIACPGSPPSGGSDPGQVPGSPPSGGSDPGQVPGSPPASCSDAGQVPGSPPNPRSGIGRCARHRRFGRQRCRDGRSRCRGIEATFSVARGDSVQSPAASEVWPPPELGMAPDPPTA